MLTIEKAHVPISVSIGDTLGRESTNICERDPAELVRKLTKELKRRGKNNLCQNARGVYARRHGPASESTAAKN